MSLNDADQLRSAHKKSRRARNERSWKFYQALILTDFFARFLKDLNNYYFSFLSFVYLFIKLFI